MSPSDPRAFSEDIRECWAVHQAFRSLGFLPDNIYISVGRDIRHPQADACLFVVLKAQGKDFTVTVGAYPSEEKATAAVGTWHNFVTLANGGAFERESLDKIYESSHVFANSVELVLSLHEKGIRPMMEWS